MAAACRAGAASARVGRNSIASYGAVGYTGAVDDPYPLRPATEDEFGTWARMVADTYGSDLSDEQLARERAATELPRTIAAFDGPAPVGGAAAHARVLTVPGALLRVAGITWVAVTPTHRRRGILTSLMRRQLTDLHTSGTKPIAALRPSEAAIHGRYGYGPATQGARLRCDKRAVRFRPEPTSATEPSDSWDTIRPARRSRSSTTESGSLRSAGPAVMPPPGTAD